METYFVVYGGFTQWSRSFATEEEARAEAERLLNDSWSATSISIEKRETIFRQERTTNA